MLAIARAVVARSQLLLLDEPLSNLDSELKSTLIEELSVLQRLLNLTALYVTHDKSEAASFAHSIVRMKNGRIEEIVESDESKLNASAKAILMTCEE